MEPGYFERVKALIETDTYLRNTYNSIISQADVAVANTVNSQYPATYGESFRAKTLPEWKMIPNLTIAYKMTGEVKYKDRLWQAIITMTHFPDWHSGSFLDVGDNTQIIAYAYDWVYDDWSEEQKTIMRNSFVKKGFEPSMYMLRSGTGFASVGHNWNQVISSGLGLAALAMVGEDGYNDICNEIINRTIEALAYGCASFAPDGGSVEGPGYWLYAQQTFFQYQAGLMTAAGDDGGMSQREGLSKTGYYILSMNGPTNQCFNYSD